MNLITQIVFVLILWLVMGLGFLSAYSEAKRKGRPGVEAWRSLEGLLFVISLLVPIIILIHRNIDM